MLVYAHLCVLTCTDITVKRCKKELQRRQKRQCAIDEMQRIDFIFLRRYRLQFALPFKGNKCSLTPCLFDRFGDL